MLRAQILERRLMLHLLPEDELRRQLTEEREATLQRHGARRRLSVLQLQDGGDADATRAEIEQIRERIQREIPFAEAARSYSDDPSSRVSGGDVGWHNRVGSKLPPEVIEAAFAGEVGEVSGPVRTADGFCLVQVAAAEQEPNEALLMARMRQAFETEERLRVLEAAQIEFTP